MSVRPGVLTRHRGGAFVTVVAASALVLAASCGSSSQSTSGSSPSAPAGNAVAASAAVPAGTTLRVGDQLDYLQTILGVAGQDTGLPYKVEWAGFIGGPPMLQAFHAGAIDAGFVADTPMIFAQAAHQDVVAVAGWATQHGTSVLVAAPGSGISSWSDLRGKKVALQKGTSAEATVLQGLQSVNLHLSDISAVDLPITQVSAALQGGSVPAGILAPPLDSAYLKSHPGAKVIDPPDDLTARVSFLVASRSAIENPAKAAALRDFILRFGRSLQAIKRNPDPFVEKFYVAKYGLTLAAGRALLAQVGTTSYVNFDSTLDRAQQRLADLYQSAGEIPDKIDASKEFDSRFADAVRESVSG